MKRDVTEYVRQLNRQSVTLRDEWLDRLRLVECDNSPWPLVPEIVVAPNPAAIRSSSGTTYEPPVTTLPQSKPQPQVVTDRTPPGPVRQASELAEGKTAAPPIESRPIPPSPAATGSRSPAVESITTSWLDLEEILREVEIGTTLPTISDQDLSEMVSASVASPTHRTTPDNTVHEHDSGSDNVSLRTDTRHSTPVTQPDLEIPGPREILQVIEPEPLVSGESSHVRDDLEDDELTESDETATAGDKPSTDIREPQSPRSIERIVDGIVQRFPDSVPSTILLIGAHSSIDVDRVAARVAQSFADRETRTVLLVDANTASRRLTATMGAAREPGLAEVINRSLDLDSVIGKTDHPRLDFLPCGAGEVTNRKLDTCRAATLNSQFHAICGRTIISGGAIGDIASRRWAPFADGCYLLVDLDHADREQTRRVVEGLRREAVRLAGVIAVRCDAA